MPITLVVTMLLQMGWIELPPYFFTVSKTGRDVEEEYVDTPVESLALHKFVKLTKFNPECAELPQDDSLDDPFNYILEVYMYYYIVMAIPGIRSQLHHVTDSVMTDIHDVFPPYNDDLKME